MKTFAKDWIIPEFLLDVDVVVDTLITKLDGEIRYFVSYNNIIKDCKGSVAITKESFKRYMMTFMLPGCIDAGDSNWWNCIERQISEFDEEMIEEFDIIFDMYLDETKIPNIQ